MKPLKISIVIPAHNEEESLPATLVAALAQDYPDFEIIVVDNASKDKTSEVAHALAKNSSRIKVVREDKKGLLHARERGRIEAVKSGSDIIVQMDADCLPEVGWLARGAAHFVDDRVSGATGPYLFYDGRPIFRFVTFNSQKYLYRLVNYLVQKMGKGAVLIGGNTFIRATALEKAGGYDTSILFYGEDTDTAHKVSKYGHVVFDPRLVQKTSARRFKSEGSLKIAVLYIFHFFKVLYKGRKKPVANSK
jgi:glycosyltransferase involved in cell wall biosynthesis